MILVRGAKRFFVQYAGVAGKLLTAEINASHAKDQNGSCAPNVTVQEKSDPSIRYISG